MEITIVKRNTKNGPQYFAHKPGFLSWLGIYCFWNEILGSQSYTKEECINFVKRALAPNPKANTKVISKIEI